MNWPLSPVSTTSPRSEPPSAGQQPAGPRTNLTERVAGWAARHRKTAVFGWLLLVAALFLLGPAAGSKNLPLYDAGQAGQAERVLHQVAPAQYNNYSETVLI